MNFQFNTVVLKEKRRGYSYCENNDKFDIVKNLAKPRKAKVLRMPEKWLINILSLLRKENCGVQKVNAGIARSCRLGLFTPTLIAGLVGLPIFITCFNI
jgi:hypothetical protein